MKSRKELSRDRAKSREIADGKRQDKNKDVDKDHGSIPLSILQSEASWSQRIEFKNAKKRFAVNFGYLGSAYHGLQINPGGVLTIEAMLEKAMYLAGGIRNENFGNICRFVSEVSWVIPDFGDPLSRGPPAAPYDFGVDVLLCPFFPASPPVPTHL